MSALFPTYAKWEIQANSGNGAILKDQNHKEYLDFMAGIAVCNLGHCHPRVNEAVKKQLDKVWHVSNLFHIEAQEKVAQLLVEHSVGDYVFFTNSGAEANEAAIKLARKATGKHHIVTLKQSFHGRTLGTLAATGQEKVQEGFGPLLSSFSYVELNDEKALQQEVTEDTAAIMVEVIQGEGGVHLMDESFSEQLKAICHEKGCLLIVDEVQTGIGRTGTAFGYEQWNLSPDIFTLAKGLGNGFPVGAMVGKASLKEAFGTGSHGSTFGGNPLAMAAAEAVLQEVFLDETLAHVQDKGELLQNQLKEQLSPLGIVKDIRGKGLMIGIECTIEVADLLYACRKQGLLVLPAGAKVIRLLPPFVITNEQINQAVSMLAAVLKEADEKQSVNV
ncbi:acetylornithine transaminase [Halalkalibacter hemicellulosilyticus]|uniref:Acetylornithine aminotransferase n=1 Tax=Halalkalibacter hemicellulosilyticusJCM 9152 TaxID=1236971 RepID=W4QHS4_9BACI|nr:acetylornithine transaminase [Halalkalibacter hemicellulosilyticus]GAE31208.1 acetylornithine aminotransferase [Halalkalibacter hemicellulosilyticusJCM 9152]